MAVDRSGIYINLRRVITQASLTLPNALKIPSQCMKTCNIVCKVRENHKDILGFVLVPIRTGYVSCHAILKNIFGN